MTRRLDTPPPNNDKVYISLGFTQWFLGVINIYWIISHGKRLFFFWQAIFSLQGTPIVASSQYHQDDSRTYLNLTDEFKGILWCLQGVKKLPYFSGWRLVHSDEQTSKGWPCSLLNDEQMSN